MWLLAGFVIAGFSWQLFPNGPLAFYITQALLVMALCLRLAWKSKLAVVYLYGALMALMTAGCGGLYAAQADGFQFLCDAGSGIPVSLVSGVGALLVLAYLTVRKR